MVSLRRKKWKVETRESTIASCENALGPVWMPFKLGTVFSVAQTVWYGGAVWGGKNSMISPADPRWTSGGAQIHC